MVFTKIRRQTSEKMPEEMSNSELYEFILKEPKNISKISEETLMHYFETELDGRNLLELFPKMDFENQQYFIQMIPQKKMQNMLKSVVEFHHVFFIDAFAKFLCNLVADKKENQKEIFQKIENIIWGSGKEELILMLFELFCQMKKEDFFAFYQNSSKPIKIEILERIFSDFSNTSQSKLLQDKAKFALEKKTQLREKIVFTEHLYLAYIYR